MTKKLLSILLAVLMVLTFVTPAMAVTKPKKLKSTDVDKMQIRAYASGTETFSPNSEMYSCSPSIKAKGVDYTIGEVEGNEEDGYTTTVTFHFKSGDNFEAAARNVFSTDKHFLAIKEWADHWVGDWEYDFTEERPADQVLTLYWVTNSLGKGSWKIKSTIPGSEYAGNITAAVANLIKVNLKLERTVVYTDGVSGEAFDNQTYTVRNGEATPVFTGTPTREGYNFLGWEPKVAEKVYEDATYTAQWEVKDFTVKYVDGVSGEAFEAEEYTVKAGEATPAFQGDLTKYPGWKFKAWTPDLAETVTEDVTYTATWEPKGANTIIYWGNGGTRSKYSVGDTFWSEYTSDAEIKVRGNGFLSFALDEYAFNGWNTKADGTGDSYKSGDMYKFTAAHDLDMANLYAQWKLIAFNVSFNSNGGNTLDPIKVTLNKPYGTLPSAGSINGLQNLGWYLVDEQGNVTDTAVNAKTVVTLERDHTLFQKREIKTPTVKISLSRPVYNYLDKPVSLNASLTEYHALKYSYQWYKDGAALANDDLYDGVNTKSLTLKHDYVSASGVYKLVVTVTLADGSDIVVTNSPVTAEASYTLNIRRTSNMLYYNANGGEGGPSNNSDYYDKANDRYVAKVQSSQPTRSEWKFIGWNTKADGTGDSYKAGDFYVFDRQLSENGGLKAWLYAQWDHLTCAENLEDVKVITEPTCTEKGLKLCRCTVCGDEYEVEIPALGHDHGGRWTWNREEHWKKCLRCGAIIDCEEHTYGDWKPVVDNKGKDTDREERSCTVCGFTQYAQTIHIGGSTVTKPTDEQNPNTGAQVPSLLPALAVLAGAAVVLRKRK